MNNNSSDDDNYYNGPPPPDEMDGTIQKKAWTTTPVKIEQGAQTVTIANITPKDVPSLTENDDTEAIDN